MEPGFFRSEEELKLAKAKYEKFKLTWMFDHNFTLADLIHELDALRVESDPSLSVETMFADWEFGYGFGSQIWPCFEEFLECEYKEMETTHTLTSCVNGLSPELTLGSPDSQKLQPPQSKPPKPKEAER